MLLLLHIGLLKKIVKFITTAENLPVYCLFEQSVKMKKPGRKAKEEINRSIDQSINQSINQSIDRSIDRSINQSIKQSVDQRCMVQRSLRSRCKRGRGKEARTWEENGGLRARDPFPFPVYACYEGKVQRHKIIKNKTWSNQIVLWYEVRFLVITFALSRRAFLESPETFRVDFGQDNSHSVL